MNTLVQFQHRIVSGDSPYDRWLLGEAELSTEQLMGLELFESARLGCSQCHGGIFFDQPSEGRHGYANTGMYNVDGNGSLPGHQGLYEHSGLDADRGRFRIPSLRNVLHTGPWGHDGSFLFLEDVIDSYARGGRLIESGPYAGDGALSPRKDPRIGGFELTATERVSLLAFLGALSDHSLLDSEELATPFCLRRQGELINAPCIEQANVEP